MIAPVTIKEHALDSMRYFLNESEKVISQFETQEKTLINLDMVSLVAFAVFSCVVLRNSVLAITRKSFAPLRYTGSSGVGLAIITYVYFKYIKPSFQKASLYKDLLNSFSEPIKSVALGWETGKIGEIDLYTRRVFADKLTHLQVDYATQKENGPTYYRWIFSFPNQDKTIKALANIMIVQFTLDLLLPLKIATPGLIPRLMLGYLHYSDLPPEAKTKIVKIADFVQKNPSFNYPKALTLSALDDFDPEAIAKTV